MATATTDLNAILRRFYPAASLPDTPVSSKDDVTKLSTAVFPTTSYTDAEHNEVAQWLEKAKALTVAKHDSGEFKELNTHLATRTTVLGAHPSVADVVILASLLPQVKAWSPEERTGQSGYHNIIRYVDFVQHSPIFGLSMKEDERVAINPDDVVFRPKPIDPKEEKERKKKEKAAAAAAAGTAAGDSAKQIPVRESKEGKAEQAKDAVGDAATAAKEKAKEAAAAAGFPTEGKKKKEKQPRQARPAAPAAPVKPVGPNLIDLRVGHILKCERHPDADSLFVSTMDVGDAPGTKDTTLHEASGKTVRTVCSGLNGLVPLESMQNRKVVAVCNLKPVKMRGITSCAMVLAASPRLAEGEEDTHAGPVELVEIPEGAVAGTRIEFEGFEGEPEGQLNPKKKVWEAMQVGFTTLEADGTVAFDRSRTEVLAGDKGEGKPDVSRLRVKGGGECKVPTLRNAVVR